MNTIQKLIDEAKEYIIPIYQRNYEWTDIEINQLIEDILNAPEKVNYHIGRLVLAKNNDSTYSVIDGQQRLTTITLILYTLGITPNFNLAFQVRDEYNKTLNSLKVNFEEAVKNVDDDLIYTINRFIKPKLVSIDNSKFKNKLLGHVLLGQNILPPGTDVNHYFERMNNSGKQLEKTDILRAKLLKKVTVENRFEMWDECAKLDNYSKCEAFSASTPDSINNSSIENILHNLSINNKVEDIPTKKKEKEYDAVIDFPNFLLIVLQLFKINLKISLNDKQLLQEFGYYEDSIIDDPEEFLEFLIDLKKLFDKFIIKRSFNDNEPYWVLLNGGKNTFPKTEPENTEEETEINNLQQKLIKIQSVLHATYPSNTYKEWLLVALSNIWKNKENTDEFIGKELLIELNSFIKEKVKEHLTDNLPTNNGLSIPRIVFYYTDYLLWKFYFENIRGNKDLPENTAELLRQLSKHIDKDKFDNFNFRSFSSIEHLYPQNPDNRQYINEKPLNSFGNLCLISRSANSKYNNLEPRAKKEHATNSHLNESLKQSVMFKLMDEYNNWNTPEIKAHEEEIQALIGHYLNPVQEIN